MLWRRGWFLRADVAAQFGISPNQATQDIGTFEAAYPDAMRYNQRTRRYEAVEGYASLRGLDDPRIVCALHLLHLAGHQLGWPDPLTDAADAAAALLAEAGTGRDALTSAEWARLVDAVRRG